MGMKIEMSALLALALSFSAWGEEIPVSTVVRFNTVCTNCHEGECSGRLSFQSGAPAARNHIRRYLGMSSEREIGDLFALLKYTKEKCAPYPLKPPESSQWSASDLANWHNPIEGGYFIPLGALKPGEHRLRLIFAGEPQGRVRVTDTRFDLVAEEQLCRGGAPLLVFTASGGEYFLHLQTQAGLLGLELDMQR